MMRNACLLLLGACLWAAPLAAETSASMGKRYLKLKDNGDLFVGEGSASLKDFKADGLKALEAAKERARASLAASVRVRIVSETKEESKSGPEGTSESLESRSASMADVVLENVRYEDFIGFPEEGTISSLAFVSKLDYRRQLAGKGPRVYRPEWGLRLAYVAATTFSLDKLVKDEDAKRRSGNLSYKNGSNNQASGSGGSADSLNGIGLEFRFRDWSLYAELASSGDVMLHPYDPVVAKYDTIINSIQTATVGAGYDWTPFAWRFQPYIPLGLRYTHVYLGRHEGWAPSASGGLGLRWWPNDSLAFDFSGRYVQGLATATLKDESGAPFFTSPGTSVEFSPTGAQWQVSLLWSGF